MRWQGVLLALAASCTSSDTAKPAPERAPPVPRVEHADVFAIDEGRPPPLLVLIDDAGARQFAAASSWRELASRDLRIGARPGKLEVAAQVLGQSLERRLPPAKIVAAIASTPDLVPSRSRDDLPRAEEEEDDDDIHNFDGLAFDQWTDEAEPPPTADAREVQRQVAARARQRANIARTSGDNGARRVRPALDGEPVRLATVVGSVATDGRFAEPPMAVILASPRAKASAMIETLTQIPGLIAVAHRGAIRPLRLWFAFEFKGAHREPRWIEARVSTRGIAIEAVPDVPVSIAWQGGEIDRAALGAALERARSGRKLDRLAPVDVLVEPDVDVQRLVDVLVALDLVGVRMIGLGDGPVAGSPEAAKRGRRVPRVIRGRMSAQGDLDKGLIGAALGEKHAEILACYQTALAGTPDLGGRLNAQFFITPKGTVAVASASGVDPAVAECVAGAIKSVVFPPPKGGGGVQVTQPFTLRP